MTWKQIKYDEFTLMRHTCSSRVEGFGLHSTFTDMSSNYAETVWGTVDTPMLKTEHINGVSNKPNFYKKVD